MKKSFVFLLGAVCFLITTSAFAEDNRWLGINTASTGSGVTNVDDAASWSLGRVPGVGNDDRALFYFDGNAATQGNIYVTSDNLFAPSAIYFNGNSGGSTHAQTSRIYLNKSLTLTNLTIRTYTGSGSASRDHNRFNIGEKLTLSGDGEVLDMYPKNTVITLNADVDITGSDIVFSGKASGNMGGSSKISVVNENANVSLGYENGPALGLGYNLLFVRANQVWDATADSYLSGYGNSYTNVINSVDEGRLDNLGGLNVLVGRPTNATVDMTFRGGSYGSFRLTGADGGSGRNCRVKQTGDVSFTQKVPNEKYAIHLRGSGSSNTADFYTEGYRLELLAGSLELVGYQTKNVRLIDTLGTGIYINGDINIYTPDRSPWVVTNGLTPTTSVGIAGDEHTELFFTGSYSNNCKSYSGSGLSMATVYAVGEGNTQYFEVGDSKYQTALASSTFGIDTLNVGFGSTNAYLKLVNNFLNNNLIIQTNESDKVGEKLIVNNLNINSGSTLDVNGMFLDINNSLAIDNNSYMDLNTGLVLSKGDVIDNVVGFGDMSSSWSGFQDQVKDSSQPDVAFKPVVIDSPDTPYGSSSSLNFDGNNQYVEVPGDGLNIAQDSRTPFTIELWMRGKNGADTWGYAMHRSSSDSVGASVYWLGVDGFNNTYGAAVNGKISSTAGAGGDTGVTIEPDVWHHLALTYDGTNQNVYLDGELKCGPEEVGPISNTRSNNKIGIASTPIRSNFRPIDGVIGEVRVWDYVRSQTEIFTNMYKQMTGSESGLVAYWPLDDGEGTEIEDIAGSNDGTAVNNPLWTTSEKTFWQAFPPPAGSIIIIN